MKAILYFIIACFMAVGLISCSKQEDLLVEPAHFAKVTIIDRGTLGADFGIKYNGEPMGSLVLAGRGRFAIYNKTTGQVLLEKELDVKADDMEPWYFFQADASTEPQLIRNTDKNEPMPPAGYFKIKIVNLAKNALPNKKLDLILNVYDDNYEWQHYKTLMAVGSDLDTAGYYLVKEEVAHQAYYGLSFIDHDSQQPVLAKDGNIYKSILGIPVDSKRVYTYYLTDSEFDPFDILLFRNNKYYDIIPNNLFP